MIHNGLEFVWLGHWLPFLNQTVVVFSGRLHDVSHVTDGFCPFLTMSGST